jgi:choice-of-anchor A domain-containing protein
MFGVSIDLGQSAGYSAFILPGGSIDFTVKGGSAIVGDVAVSAGSHLDLGSGAKVGPTAGTDQVIAGGIYLDTISDPSNPATVKLDGQDPNSVHDRNLAQAVNDAFAANQAAGSLAPTQNLGDVDVGAGTFTVTGNGGLNVISVGDVKLHGDGLLTLQGSATDYFVFNITGAYTMSSKSSMSLMGGVTSDHILWNFIGTGNGANLASAGQAFGTFLSPYRDFSMDDIVLTGSVISAGHLAVGSKALIVPEMPTTTALVIGIGMLLGVNILRRRRLLS